MKRLTAVALVLCAAPAMAFGQSGYTISGGLSNFDVHNRTDEPCDEFEIEIEGIRPEDVVHTYRNGNYGSPTVTLSQSGVSTIIDYRHPLHLTAINTIEHFGVSLTQLTANRGINVRWKINGRIATVNGQVPNPIGGSSPATQPQIPTISAGLLTGSTGGDSINVTVINNDPAQAIWVQRRATVTTGLVTLEALMRNDPVINSTVQLDPAPFLLGPGGQTASYNNDLIEVEDNQSVVFAAAYFQDLAGSGPFNPVHILGPELGNVMTASLANQGATCSTLSPLIQEQPMSTDGPAGSTVNLRVRADGNDLPTTYQWSKDGVDLIDSPMYRGVDTDELSIEEITPDSEGFYRVRVSNTCGSTTSDSALVFVTGHNVPPPPPPPPACEDDLNQDGNADQGDVDFLINVVAGGANDTNIDPDFNQDGNVDQGDIDALINVVAGGNCP